MTTIRKTITLTDAQDDWIKAQIDSGSYTNDSEVLRDLIRKAQQEDADIKAIRAALIEGERSGMSQRSPEDIRAALKK
ncbi:type II toxin-antitoxin system ParD family antitoxin [Hyphomonas sp.]|uniref:type II toxin-antitoxin system ParD family antitoxin n=1 Tax=Hyphomonas sp. TaxID=87 RepID=UPI00391D95AA